MTMLSLKEGKKVSRPSNSCNMKLKFMKDEIELHAV